MREFRWLDYRMPLASFFPKGRASALLAAALRNPLCSSPKSTGSNRDSTFPDRECQFREKGAIPAVWLRHARQRRPGLPDDIRDCAAVRIFVGQKEVPPRSGGPGGRLQRLCNSSSVRATMKRASRVPTLFAVDSAPGFCLQPHTIAQVTTHQLIATGLSVEAEIRQFGVPESSF